MRLHYEAIYSDSNWICLRSRRCRFISFNCTNSIRTKEHGRLLFYSVEHVLYVYSATHTLCGFLWHRSHGILYRPNNKIQYFVTELTNAHEFYWYYGHIHTITITKNNNEAHWNIEVMYNWINLIYFTISYIIRARTHNTWWYSYNSIKC